MKISVVVPTLDNPTLLRYFLDNLKCTGNVPNHKLVVVSDHSSTQEEELAASLGKCTHFVKMKSWAGYAKAVNEGAKVCHDSDIVIFMNTDITFRGPVLDYIAEDFKKDPKLAVVGAKLYNSNGTIQHAGGYWIYGRDFVNYGINQTEEQFRPFDVPFYPEEVTGAIYAVQNKIFKKLGRFDEVFKFWYEDPEYCYLCWEKGYKVLYDPRVEAIHTQGGSRKRVKDSRFDIAKVKSRNVFEKRAITRPWNKIQTNIFNANKGKGPDPGLFLIERLGERGDLIQLTTTIRAIKRAYPEHEILVRTNYPEIFKGNPDVEDAGMVESPYARKIDFNVSAEKHLTKPMAWGHWNTVTNECGLNIGPFKQSKPIMYSNLNQWNGFLQRTGFNPKKPYAVVHQPITNFRSKTLPWITWAETQAYLESLGLDVVIVGTHKDIGPINSNMQDYRGKTDIQELRELIRHAELFVGLDSGPANVCQTAETPGVVIFTGTDPSHILCASNVVPVVPSKGMCRFCQQRQKPPCGYIDCPDGKNYECAKSIRITDIEAAIQERLTK